MSENEWEGIPPQGESIKFTGTVPMSDGSIEVEVDSDSALGKAMSADSVKHLSIGPSTPVTRIMAEMLDIDLSPRQVDVIDQVFALPVPNSDEPEDELLAALKDTFEPANLPWFDLDGCRRCRARTLRTPRWDTSGKIAMAACPGCNFINFVPVRIQS